MTTDWREREAWRFRARCYGEDINLWFPETFAGAKAAKAICNDCPVRRDCLHYALTTHTREGVWGGFYGAEINKKGRKFLDNPAEFYEGRRKPHVRLASDRRVIPKRHDNPEHPQQARTG